MATGAGSARQKTQLPEKPDPVQPEVPPLEEQIRTRAHQIWLARGSQDGSAEADWLQAEKELLNATTK